MRDDPELDIIRKRGFEHEKRYLADLEAEGRTAVTITPDGSIDDQGERLRQAAAATIDAMRAGRRRRLPGDLLRRHLARPRRLPAHASSTRRDRRRGATGTTRSPTPSWPATSRPARSSRSARTSTSWSGSRASGRSGCTSPSAAAPGRSSDCASTTTWPTTAAPGTGSWRRWPAEPPATYPPVATYPEPVDHCEVCRWVVECKARREADDHLSLVAGITTRQRRGLVGRGVSTLEALGELPLPADPAGRGHERGRPRAGPRAGRPPALPSADRRAALRAAPAGPGRDARRGARAGVAARAIGRRPVLRHRGRPVRASTTGWTTCSACPRRTAPSTPSGRATRTGRSAWTASAGRSSGSSTS